MNDLPPHAEPFYMRRLLWPSSAWKMAARDGWIGWTDVERARNLQLVVNNSRFLILPWVRVRYLASTILSLCCMKHISVIVCF
ncbi:MAG TPA: Druantia anti-phage system protein DruA [Pyrinomonadaceae bacterium]